MAKDKPQLTVRSGKIKASVWSKQKKDDKSGQVYTEHNIQLVKSYKDNKGQWQETNYFFPEELPQVVAVLDTVYKKTTIKVEVTKDE